MQSLALHGHMGTQVTIDMCAGCQLFWFDRHESLRLAPASTLTLFAAIGEHASSRPAPAKESLRCPRCRAALTRVNDLQRRTRFRYWRCAGCGGRATSFFDFLKEKDFVRPMPKERISELRQHVQTTNCSNCGAAIDLLTSDACAHCGSPLTMFDMSQAERIVAQLRDASQPRPVDPTLPMALVHARQQAERAFRELEDGDDWWREASSAGMVSAGLAALSRWLRRGR